MENFDCIPLEIIERAGKPVAVKVETIDTPTSGAHFETLPITSAAVPAFSDGLGDRVTVERYTYKAKTFYRRKI